MHRSSINSSNIGNVCDRYALHSHQMLAHFTILFSLQNFQDLERARLLCELVRKRERLKAAFIRTMEQAVMMELNPLEAAMGRLLDSMFAKDEHGIFAEPVDIEDVPDYMDIVTHPMDLGTMRAKLRNGNYHTLDDMENDFSLMISNCLAYNTKHTFFYRVGNLMRDKCSPLFKAARKELIRCGIVDEPQSDESLAHEVDGDLASLLKQKLMGDELVGKLQTLIEKANRIKHGMIRGKRLKMIRVEMTKAKKLSNKSGASPSKGNATAIESDTSDDEEITEKDDSGHRGQTTPSCSPMKSLNNQSSPSGVNRRTAVLFTRKAQAAASSLKKPTQQSANDESIEQNIVPLARSNSLLMSSNLASGDGVKSKSPKKSGRSRRTDSLNSEHATSIASSLSATAFHDGKASGGQSMLNAGPSGSGGSHRKSSPMKERYAPSTTMPDSFRTYRGRGMDQSSDSDDSNIDFSHSSCSSCSGESGTESE